MQSDPGDAPTEAVRLATELTGRLVQAGRLGDDPAAIERTLRALTGCFDRILTDRGSSGQKPAVPIADSVTPDHLICLEDGRRLKLLKRYLRTRYGLSPEQYRIKWGLPSDYPMAAPNYAAERARMARTAGLGRSGARATG